MLAPPSPPPPPPPPSLRSAMSPRFLRSFFFSPPPPLHLHSLSPRGFPPSCFSRQCYIIFRSRKPYGCRRLRKSGGKREEILVRRRSVSSLSFSFEPHRGSFRINFRSIDRSRIVLERLGRFPQNGSSIGRVSFLSRISSVGI